jgi:hypothetical protein
MRVKIGDKIYDSNSEPILVIFDEEEKDLIRNMGDQKKFCSFPHTADTNEILKFMKDVV